VEYSAKQSWASSSSENCGIEVMAVAPEYAKNGYSDSVRKYLAY
jgi:hypothetical protein